MTNITTLMASSAKQEQASMQAMANNIEAIYPLAPMQEGLLFHTLMNPAQGMYLLQYRHVMEMDDLDIEAFQKAWNAVVDRHDLLRTAFVWKQQKRPLQVVFKDVDLPVEWMDWRDVNASEQKQRLEDMLAEERQQELVFNQAPMMRVRLIRLAENRYQFVRSYHHILMDAWCFSLIMMDFLAFYRAFVKGQELTLKKPRPYRDFIRWLREQPANAHERFWTDRLLGFDTPTSLGIRQPDQFPEAQSVVDVVEHLSIDDTKKLQALAAQYKVTLNTLLQGAWALLLNRYSGEQDILFGVTVAGRPTHMEGMESIVGLFINTLPLRWSVTPTDSLGDWLRALQQENLALREHETSSLADIQQWSEVEGQDLFQSLFVFENAPMDAGLSQENLEFIVQDATNRTHTNYPITVVIIPGESLHLQLTYQGRDFSHASVQTMLAHFQTLLLSMVEQSNLQQTETIPLHRLSMLQGDDVSQHSLWAKGPELSLGDQYIERFLAQVDAHPDKVAVSDGARELTYLQLDQSTNLLAQQLIEQGVAMDSIVSILGERSCEFLVMIIAVLKSGAAYLPLDPNHPPLRLAQVLKQSRSPLVLTSNDYESLAQDALAELRMLQATSVGRNSAIKPNLFPFALAAELPLSSAEAQSGKTFVMPNVNVSSQNLGYVIFTSGSTGTPKGAMVTREGMLNNMLGKFAPLALTDRDVIAQTASQCFDISVWQFLIAPILGARVEILPDCISQDPARLIAEVDQRGITVLEPVPALIQGILSQESKHSLSSLRWVLPTGEALPPVLAQQWSEHYPAIPMMNAYGPAECSDDVAFYAITKRLDDEVRHVPIGSATANNRLYLLSPELEPMPIGAIGEVYVAGTGVGRGYLNEPERTAGVFLPNPFASQDGGERLYRTGDLARYLPDGNLQYVGRVDYQVKVRGYRIELGEIESRLAQHPEIDEVVLQAITDAKRGKVLVAYVAGQSLVSKQGEFEQENWRILRDFVAQGLPDYMVPSAFVAMAKLPRNNNGKIDRKQLPEVDFASQQTSNYVEPSTPLQQSLSHIWQNLLGLERVGIEDNFFELGGHSLLATQMAGQVTRELKREVPLRTVFEQPTIVELSKWLETNDVQPSLPPLVTSGQTRSETIDKGDEKRAVLSWSQQRMWFLQQLEPQSAAYNLPAAIRVRTAGSDSDSKLDLAIAEEALNIVVAQHDILRTHFVIENTEPVQVVIPSLELSISHVRLQSLEDEKRQNKALEEALKADAMTPFHLDKGPLIRVNLFELEMQTGQTEQVLSFNCHHIIADAWSLRLLVDQFCQAYECLSNKEPVSHLCDGGELQYSDYAIWQRQLMEEGYLESQLQYWLNLIKPNMGNQHSGSDLPVLELSRDFPRPEYPTGAGQRFVTRLSKAAAQKLIAFDQKAGRSHFASTMAAFQLLLGFYSGQRDILIGVPVANRHHSDTQMLMGCFINTLIHRADLSPEQTVSQLIDAVAKQALKAQANQDLPFDYLIDQLGVDRQMSYNPLFQSMFNYLSGRALDQLQLKGIEVEVIDNRPDTALCDFKLDVQAYEGEFNLSFEYSTELFRHDTVVRMANDFERILVWMLEHADARLAEIDLWTESNFSEPRSTLLAPQPASEKARLPQADHILDLFTKQVVAQPDTIAIRTGALQSSASINYAELNQRSDAIAAELQIRGVTPGDRVALFIDRDHNMPVCILAVLKCGAAYVPIEPAWPEDRTEYILTHSEPSFCLVNISYEEKIRALKPQLASLVVDSCIKESFAARGKFIPNKQGSEVDQLAYILYTSGSTGRPKGVEISTQNLAHLCRELANRVPLNRQDQVLSLTTYCFDISVVELIYPLTQGASILVASNEQAKDPRLLDQVLDQAANEKAVSLMQATPATWSMLLARSKRSLEGVTAIAGGEALSAELGRQILSRGAKLINGYGPTEVTVYSTFHPVTEADCSPSCADSINSAALPIGKPVIGLNAHVLDTAMRSVPIGVTGELYLSGDGVGMGYHKAPDLTEKAFIHHSIAGADNRFYKTGDLVRRRSDGTLDYLGRNDFQVKLRGFRIELGEIEALLPQLDGVENAVVLLEGKGDQAKLVAYWAGEQRDAGILRQHVAGSLPEYMVPTFWRWVDSLPQNANGKVDRKALLGMALDTETGLESVSAIAPEQAQASRSEPQTLWEQRLAVIWMSALFAGTTSNQTVAREDNFFALGGHSLLAARIVATLAEEFGIELPLRVVFEKPTLASMAEELELLSSRAVDSDELSTMSSVSIPISAVTDNASDQVFAPMHATQKRLWFLEKFSGASRAYQLTLTLKLGGSLDEAVLRKALYELSMRQHSLRTLFVEQDGDLYQKVIPESEFSLDSVPLRIHSTKAELFADYNQADLIETLKTLADQPFFPEKFVPWRVDLLVSENSVVTENENEEQVLQLCMHHLIADAWSLRIFFDELHVLYQSQTQQSMKSSGSFASHNQREQLELPYQFGDFARWWQSDESKSRLEKQLAYWQKKLAGEQPLLDLPTDLARPKQLSNSGRRYRFKLPKEMVEQLQQVGVEHHMTAFVPLLNAWQLLLSRYSGQKDIRVGIPVANRHLAHSRKLIGYFASTQVINAPVAVQKSVADNWMALKQTLTEAQQNQDLPFEQLVESLSLSRDNGRAPLFQTLFNLIQLDGHSQFADFATDRINLDEGTTLSEFGMQIEQGENEWFCVLEYSNELFVEDTVARYGRHYISLLAAMLNSPEKLLCQLDMLDGSDYAMEAAFNDTDAELKAEHDLVSRFEAQVAKTPNAEAIRYREQSINYQVLNTEVNRLAYYLMKQGIGAEHKVAILLERGPRMMIAHLAVLKAGGVYIPLDPSQPADRLSYICQHAKPTLVIAESASVESIEIDASTLLLNDLPSVALGNDEQEAFSIGFNLERNPRIEVHPAQLAYLIYTSGSTGKPKGVAVNRGNLANFLYALDEKVEVSADDCWLSVTTTSFDMSVLEIYLPLLRGATLLLADRRQAVDADALFELVRQSSIFQATSASWQMLLNNQATDWPSLKGIIGGEAVPTHLAKQLIEKGVQLLNAYGPTETTVWSTTQGLDELEVAQGGTAAIGLPVINNRCYLLDEALQPVPHGATGEVYIAGEGVTRGYQDAPDLTAAAFIPDPFRQDGGRLYKTGDLARRRADGALEYIGRSDFQIKIRGFRIELGEIESVLRRHRSVNEVVVVADVKQRLVAFFQGATDIDAGELRGFLEAELPAYMVPYQFIAVEVFPLNSNEKIDRKALTARASELSALKGAVTSADSGRAPDGDIEIRLAEIWQSLLDVAPSAEQSFFVLGGHSLLAMQMISKVEAEFGIRLALQALFEQPTIAALAQQIAVQSDDQQDDELDFMDQLLSEFED